MSNHTIETPAEQMRRDAAAICAGNPLSKPLNEATPREALMATSDAIRSLEPLVIPDTAWSTDHGDGETGAASDGGQVGRTYEDGVRDGARIMRKLAAVTAEHRHNAWAYPTEVSCDVTACEDIALAIRTLELPKGTGR